MAPSPDIDGPTIRRFTDFCRPFNSWIPTWSKNCPRRKWSKIVQESWIKTQIFALLDDTRSWSADPGSSSKFKILISKILLDFRKDRNSKFEVRNWKKKQNSRWKFELRNSRFEIFGTRFWKIRNSYYALVRGSQLNFYFKPSCQYQTSHGHQNGRERVNKIWISFLVKIRLYRPSKILERLFECPYWELLIIFWFFLIPNRGGLNIWKIFVKNSLCGSISI